jgi:hypothetical protein
MPLRNLWKPRAGRLTTTPLLVFDEPFFDVVAAFLLVAAIVPSLGWRVLRDKDREVSL